MKLVLALAQLPLTEGGAVGRVAVATMRGLAQHGINVEAVVALQHFTITGQVPADLRVEVVSVEPPPQGWRGRGRVLLTPRGELAGAFADCVRHAARDADVLHLEEVETAWCHSPLVPTALRLHYLVGRDRPVTFPWRRAFRQRFEFAAAERKAVRRSRWLVANSAEIASELRRRSPRAKVTVAPLALDPLHYPRAALDGPPRAGLIGTATWPGTASAMRRLVQRVWPLVRRQVADAELVLAGRGVAQLGLGGTPGVTVAGDVESAAAFLGALSALVFPIERGSGAKVKVLEALACGVPVVTTSAGAEGAAPSDGLIVADEDEEIAAAAVAVLRDGAERRERGAAAEAAFRLVHSPVPATEALADLYRRMAGSAA